MEESGLLSVGTHTRTAWGSVLACALSAGALNLVTSNDWCFGSIKSGVLAAVGILILLKAVNGMRCSRPVRRMMRAMSWCAVAIAAALAFRLSDAKALWLVFQTSPPNGVTGIVADRKYAGGPGDQVLWLQFRADETTLRELLSHRGFEQDRDFVRQWPAEQGTLPKETLWAQVFGGLLSEHHPWRGLPAPRNFEVFRGGNRIAPDITILWDRDAAVAYVLYSLG